MERKWRLPLPRAPAMEPRGSDSVSALKLLKTYWTELSAPSARAEEVEAARQVFYLQEPSG